MNRILLYSFLAVGMCLFSSCSRKKTETVEVDAPLTYTVAPAEEWTSLFKRSHGWFGGDGIFAIPFSGVDQGTSSPDSILFLFSDTMFGEINDGALKPGYVMINNSCMVLHGKEPKEESSRFLVNPDRDKKPSSLFVPATPGAKKEDYYWLGDGFVNTGDNNNLYIFAYRIRNTDDGSTFPFREVGNALIVIPKDSTYPFSNQRQLELPFLPGNDSVATSYGVGILANTTAAQMPGADGYIYVYGIRGASKQLVAARVTSAEVENFNAWEFYNGNAWAPNSTDAAAIADSVSNELSVTPVGNGKYALIYQYAGIMPTIYMQVGPTPVGPFGPRQKIWSTADDVKEKDLFAYNAKAHPAISKPGELLVSYNVNSFNFAKQIETMPNLYRPRFVRIVFDKK